jgi:hypothetical protein
MKLFGNVIMRIVATFVASALGVIGAGAIGGVPIWAAASMGGILAVAKVIELLSLAFLEDGKLTEAEINAAFRQTVALKDVAEPEDTPAVEDAIPEIPVDEAVVVAPTTKGSKK